LVLIHISRDVTATLDSVWSVISDIDREPEFWHGTKSIKKHRQNWKYYRVSAYHWPRKIEKDFAIGSGEKYARVIIKKLWNKNMSMEQVAELLIG
jgi:hypothetical protein